MVLHESEVIVNNKKVFYFLSKLDGSICVFVYLRDPVDTVTAAAGTLLVVRLSVTAAQHSATKPTASN